MDIVSKPSNWSRGASAVSLETQPTSQITGVGKDCNSAYFNPTKCWHRLDARYFSFIGIRFVENLG